MRRSRKQPADAPSTARSAPLILAASAIGFIVRVLAARQIGALPLSRTPHYDALEYLRWAQQIAAGNFAWPINPSHGPGYPFFLGTLLAAGDGSLMFARFAQALAGAATCYIAGRIAERSWGLRAGVVSAALLAVYAPLVWLDVSIASEGLLMLFLAAALWAATSKRPVATGVLTGLAALTRPTAFIFLPLFVWLQRDWRRRATTILLAVAVIVPVTIANWRSSNAFIPIQAFGGMNVYLGNSPLRDGRASARPGADWERIEPEAARNGAIGVAEEDRYFIRKTMSEITTHPIGFVRVLGLKALATFQHDELRDTHSFYFFREHAPLLWLPGFAILFAFAAAGMVSADWRTRPVHVAAAFTLFAALTCIALVAGARYRLPLTLGLALFGGLAAVNWRARRYSMIVAAVIVFAFSFIPRDAASRNVAEEWALTASSFINEGRPADAEEAARKAISIDPSSALAWDRLGMVHAGAGRSADAKAAFERALSLNPSYALAHEHLGLLLAQMGDVTGAAEEYRRAVEIDPRNANALFGVARLEGALGRASQGVDFALRATRLRPASEDEWLLVAMLAADAKRFDVVDDALRNVDPQTAAMVRERIQALRK